MSRIPTRQAILGWSAMAPCAHGPMLDLNALFIAPSHGRNEVGALLGGTTLRSSRFQVTV